MTSVHPSPRSRLDERAMVSGISKPSARPAGPARGDCRNDHGVRSLLLYRGKCRFEILWARYLRDVELEPRCLGGRLILLYERLLPSIRLRSLDQQAKLREARKEFSKEFQPLPGKRCGHVCEACDVASGPREAWHQTSRYWISSRRHDDRDRSCRVLCSLDRGGELGHDHTNVEAHEFQCERATPARCPSLG